MRSLFFALLLALSVGCKSDPKATSAHPNEAPQQAAATKGITFTFSQAPAITGFKDARDWCNLTFFKALTFYAVSGNINQRYCFLPPNKVVRLAVSHGDNLASMMLQKLDNSTFAIYTSNNFPYCLSNFANYKANADYTKLHYENEKHLVFDFSAQAVENGYVKLTLDLPPNSGYAMIAHECIGCGEH